ncbi:transforming growth factor beta activator LRRC32 [Tachyglossus aculeatus]|uniref:transforming growth factor beta activator LRRC32 n=1 Tax=Tachyglossus aculeatus TaxID=9261 RepID=UPI0018F59E5E|nr:transforming growth factor beta activator LRRC32 [Tachyglossus aculeatus]
MNLCLLLVLLAAEGGICTFRPLEESPCDMAQLDALCPSRGLEQVPATLHPDVRKIDLSGNRLLRLTEQPLAFYAALRHLDASANRISAIEAGLFARLPQLTHLNLARNRLDLLAPPGPSGLGLLPRVARLDLSANRLFDGLAEAFLRAAPALRSLSLAENSLTRLSARMFRGCPALEELDLHSNVVLDIEDGALDGLSRLSVLNLSTNSITCISDFSLRPLRRLDLSRNSIESFQVAEGPDPPGGRDSPDGPDSGHLDSPGGPDSGHLDSRGGPDSGHLDSPGGPDSPDGQDSGHLDSPDDPDSGHRDSPDGPDSGHLASPDDPDSGHLDPDPSPGPGQFRLSWLDLRENRLLRFPRLPPANQLTYLSLANNLIRLGPADGPEGGEWPSRALGRLQHLDLSSNEVEAVPAGFLEPLASLRVLNLSRNCLRAFSGPARGPGLAALEVLDLSHNALRRFSAGARGLARLRQLLLQRNALEALPPATWAGLAAVRLLDLRGNRVSVCEPGPGPGPGPGPVGGGCAALSGLASLRHLDLAENGLGRLPDGAFRGSPLAALDLSGNPGLRLGARALDGLEPWLRALHLRGNALAALAVPLALFPHLERLSLAANRLSRLPRWPAGGSLRVLDLRNNSFSHLRAADVAALARTLRTLDLAGNPLSCCGNAWLAALVRGRSALLPEPASLTCRLPRGPAGREEVRVCQLRPDDCQDGPDGPDAWQLLLALALLLALLLLALLLLLLAGPASSSCARRYGLRRRQLKA